MSGFRQELRQALTVALFLFASSELRAEVEVTAETTAVKTPPASSSEGSGFDEATQSCLNAHEQGQLLRAAGKLLESRQALLACSHEQCPAIVRDDCSAWFGEVRGATPTLSISARLDGQDITQGSLSIDDENVQDAFSGKEFELNPGPHQLRLEIPGHPAQEQTVVLTPGAATRHLVFDFSPPAPQPAHSPGSAESATAPPAMTRPTPALTYWLGGITAASLISGVTFSALGLAQNNRLKESCAPYCSDEQTKSVDNKLLAADISWGLFVAAGVGTVVSYVFRPEVPAGSESSALHSWSVSARLSPSHPELSLKGAF